MIPDQLKRDDFRFVLLKSRDKIPVEKGWTEKNISYKDPKLEDWVAQGNNYGVMGGRGGLVIIDFDDTKFQQEMIAQLPQTFSVKTGSGKLHLYYLTDNPSSHKILDANKKTLADIQGSGKQVVGPSSTHPNGNQYTVENDVPLTFLTQKAMSYLFRNYLKNKNYDEKKDTELSEIKNKVRLSSLMQDYGYDTSRNPTMCKLGHESKGHSCFSWDDNIGLWHCFHCDKGGDVFSFVMQHENTDFINAKKILAKKAGIETTTKKTEDQDININDIWYTDEKGKRKLIHKNVAKLLRKTFNFITTGSRIQTIYYYEEGIYKEIIIQITY